MSWVCRVQGLLYLGFVMPRVCYIFGLSCLGSVMSKVCYIQGLLCLAFVLSSVCYVLDWFKKLNIGFTMCVMCMNKYLIIPAEMGSFLKYKCFGDIDLRIIGGGLLYLSCSEASVLSNSIFASRQDKISDTKSSLNKTLC